MTTRPAEKPTEAPEPAEQMRLAVSAALSRKAEDLKVFDLEAVSDFTDRFLICSGTNERQVQAIADAILKDLRRAGLRPLHVEGYDNAHWVLLDFGGDMVIHVFHDESRRFYDLERLWADAPEVTGQFAEEDRRAVGESSLAE